MENIYQDYKKCEDCGKWHFSSEQCQPIYFVTAEDGERTTVRAFDFHSAAQEYAALTCLNYGASTICSVENENGETRQLKITTEVVLTYNIETI